MPLGSALTPGTARLTFNLQDALVLLGALRLARDSENLIDHDPRTLDDLIEEIEWARIYLSEIQ